MQHTQIISTAEASIVLEVPEDLRGHTIEVILADLGPNGTTRPGDRVFSSVEEVHAHFNAVRIDTRGWKFDREEANRRR
jgi:hypothetical protein